jgi:hypothetical protein
VFVGIGFLFPFHSLMLPAGYGVHVPVHEQVIYQRVIQLHNRLAEYL